MNSTPQQTMLTKFESITVLSAEERTAILALPMHVQDLRADQDIVRVRDRPSRCCALIEGFACRYLTTVEGKRQIMSFHIAGELPDLQSLHLTTMDHSIQSLTPCTLGFVAHEHLHDLCANYPRIAAALWRETLIDAAIFREWMVGIGRRDASTRIAHLFCEMFERMRAIGHADGDNCPFPISQGEIGDALGLSTVHVNRTLQELRAAGLVKLNGRVLTIRDWEGLQRAGEFDPTYLHQVPRMAA